MQTLDRFNGQWIFDLKDFLSEMAQTHDLMDSYKAIASQWRKTIVYENNTEKMIESLYLNECHGISTFIPSQTDGQEINAYYKTLSWFEASGYRSIFPDI